jgi:hypothetical protein
MGNGQNTERRSTMKPTRIDKNMFLLGYKREAWKLLMLFLFALGEMSIDPIRLGSD